MSDEIETLFADIRVGAPRARHILTVKLAAGGYGPNFGLVCQGTEDSLCHIWDEEEGAGPQKHDYCAVADWLEAEPDEFVYGGYIGPDAPGVVSGPIEVRAWGEDGIEWEYAVADATEFPVGSLA